jgi:hypothetical protein
MVVKPTDGKIINRRTLLLSKNQFADKPDRTFLLTKSCRHHQSIFFSFEEAILDNAAYVNTYISNFNKAH